MLVDIRLYFENFVGFFNYALTEVDFSERKKNK